MYDECPRFSITLYCCNDLDRGATSSENTGVRRCAPSRGVPIRRGTATRSSSLGDLRSPGITPRILLKGQIVHFPQILGMTRAAPHRLGLILRTSLPPTTAPRNQFSSRVRRRLPSAPHDCRRPQLEETQHSADDATSPLSSSWSADLPSTLPRMLLQSALRILKS